MSPERWQQVKGILDTVEACPDDQKRDAIKDACGDDVELLNDVESFLELDDFIDDFIEEPLWSIRDGETDPDAAQPDDSSGARRVGPYRLGRLLGRGGMGAVYLAYREGDYEQQVALKLINWGMDSDEILARFYNERQILANLQHPGIARLLDGGTTEEGLPYFAMEYVDGEPIDEYCDHQGLSIRQRLTLFRKVCSAVHFAHQRLIVHRDLKPSNILVGEDGEPKLLDFGIAKLLLPELAPGTFATVAGRGPMTLDYASPEQILNTPITTACDVYALGVLLFRLLTGRPPYRLKDRGYAEILNIVCRAEPGKPSTRIRSETMTVSDVPAKSAAHRNDSLAGKIETRRLRRQLSGDLDAIVMKAMRKEPQHRYGSAIELSEDLNRHLVGLPVQARQGTWLYISGKFMRRQKLVLAMVALIIGFAVTVTVFWQEAGRERDQAELERSRAEKAQAHAEGVTQFLEDLIKSVNPDEAKGEDVTVREILEKGKEGIATDLDGNPELQADLWGTLGTVYNNLGFFDEARDLKEKAVEASRKASAGDNEDLANHLNNLAKFYHDTDDYEKAEKHYREALGIYQRLQLPESVATAMYNLGNLLRSQGDYTQAEKYHRDALGTKQGLFEADHPQIASSIYGLGMIQYARGDLAEAHTLFQEVLRIRSKYYDTQHTKVADILSSLGRVLWNAKRYEEAKRHFDRALDIRQYLLLNEDHPKIASTKKSLAELLLAMGDTRRAKELLDEALESLRESNPEGSWRIADAEGILGAYLTVLGRYAEAESKLIESYEYVHRVRGDDTFTRDALQRVVHLYEAWGRRDEAEKYRALIKFPIRNADKIATGDP